MRKLLWVALAVALVGLPALGGEPGGQRPGGDRRGGDRRGGDRRGGRRGGPPGGMFGGGQQGTSVFDAARQTLDLPDEAKAGVDMLDAQYADELDAAMTELRMKMNAAYVLKIIELLPADQKPKYEAVAKALADRDAAIVAARKEQKEVLDKVKTSQGADKAPRDTRQRRFGPPGGAAGKGDILRTHFVLTEQQQESLDAARRDNFGAMRDRMRGLFQGMRGPDGQRDPNAFRRIGAAMRQIREEVGDKVAEAANVFLTDAQKKDYATACAAIDTCRKATKAAEAACRKAITAAVGEEKANALLGPPPEALAKPAAGTAF